MKVRTMTISQTKKIIQRIADLEVSIDTLKKGRIEALLNGYASATISTSGGSKSYTRLTPDQFTQVINELLKELTQWKNLLVTGKGRPIKTIATIYF